MLIRLACIVILCFGVGAFFFFLNVYEILSSCHCIICTIVTLKLRTCCVEVNCIAFLKDAHLLVYFYSVIKM